MREVKVAIFGLALGLPLISLGLGFQAQERLTDDGATSWDEDGGFVITHRPVNAWQIALMAVGGAILISIRILGFVSQVAGNGG